MTLATRCSACGTVFRVVEDQLRASAGWVRCGRCQAVFNAVEHLVDVGPDSPPFPTTPGALSAYRDSVLGTLERVARQRAPAPGDDAAAARDDETAAGHEAGATADGAAGARATAGTAATAGRAATAAAGWPGSAGGAARIPGSPAVVSARPLVLPAHDPQADRAGSDATLGAEPASGARPDPGADIVEAGMASPPAAEVPAVAAARAPEPASPAALPEFIRRADRAARWRRPGVRAALALLALAMAVLLAVQTALMDHDGLAARWPAAAPALARLCAIAGCKVEPPRRIEALAVIGSSLLRGAEPGSYQLAVTLRNRDRGAVRLPAFDLVLSDAQGRLLVRRVLQPHELGADGDRIDAGAELALAALLRAGDEPVVGYAVEIFYP